MENDDKTEQARERALHLAAEVAETDDRNVPVLLLQLKGNLSLKGRGGPLILHAAFLIHQKWTFRSS